MTTENIFADQANNVVAADAAVNNATESANVAPTFTIPTELSGFVGNDKKYKTVDDALKSVPHAQTHIQNLENELKAMKEELQKRKTAEELLDEMRKGQEQQQATPGVDIDPEALSGIVERVLERKSLQTQAQANASVVASQFIAKYGDKAEQVYAKIAQDNGLSVAQLNQLSLSSPTAVLSLAGLNSKIQPQQVRMSSDVQVPTQTSQQQYNTVVKPGSSTAELQRAFEACKAKVNAQLNQ